MNYETVSRMADQLKQEGLKPSVRDVWRKVRGDYAAVAQHMKTWRDQKPQGGDPTEITKVFQTALEAEIAHQRRQAVVAVASELQEAKEEAEDFAAENGRLQAALDGATESLRAAEMEKERLAAETALRVSLAEKLQARLDEERAAMDRARLELAEVNLRSKGDANLVLALQAELDARRGELASERARRIDAERDLAGANAALGASQERVSDLAARLQSRDAELIRMQADLEEQRTLRHDAQRERDVAQEKANAAAIRADDLAERERGLRGALKMKLG